MIKTNYSQPTINTISKDSFHLPDDIMHEVLSYLNIAEDTSSLSLTCKTWQFEVLRNKLGRSLIHFLVSGECNVESTQNYWKPLQKDEREKVLESERALNKTILPFMEKHYDLKTEIFRSMLFSALFPLPYTLREPKSSTGNYTLLKQNIEGMTEMYHTLPYGKGVDKSPFISVFEMFKILFLRSHYESDGKRETLFQKVQEIKNFDFSVRTNCNQICQSIINPYNIDFWHIKEIKEQIELVRILDKRMVLYDVSNPILEKIDREIVTIAIKQNGLCLAFVDQSFKADRKIVLMAVRQNGHALKYADDSLRSKKEIVWAAVNQNGLALQYTNNGSLKEDKKIVLTAIQNNPQAARYAHPTFILGINGLALKYLDDRCKNNKSMVKIATTQNPAAIEFAGIKLREDMRYIKKLAEDNYDILKYLPFECRVEILKEQ